MYYRYRTCRSANKRTARCAVVSVTNLNVGNSYAAEVNRYFHLPLITAAS